MKNKKNPGWGDREQTNSWMSDKDNESYQQPVKKVWRSSPFFDPDPIPANPPKYIRLGVKYYKLVRRSDESIYLKLWNKSTITTDHGTRGYLDNIPKYDDREAMPTWLEKLEVR
jgi:hypothetical protein